MTDHLDEFRPGAQCNHTHRMRRPDGSEWCRGCRMELFGPYRTVEQKDYLSDNLANLDGPGRLLPVEIRQGLMEPPATSPGTCNVCGERLHKGCCNPNRPAHSGLNLTMARELGFTEEEIASWGKGGEADLDDTEVPPIALTDAHVRELERAIRAEGYRIMIDPDCNITLEKARR